MEVAVKNENPTPNANANAPLPQRNQKQAPPGNEPIEKKPRFSDINPNQNQGGPGGFQQRRNNNRMNNNRNNRNNQQQQPIKPEVSFSKKDGVKNLCNLLNKMAVKTTPRKLYYSCVCKPVLVY